MHLHFCVISTEWLNLITFWFLPETIIGTSIFTVALLHGVILPLVNRSTFSQLPISHFAEHVACFCQLSVSCCHIANFQFSCDPIC